MGAFSYTIPPIFVDISTPSAHTHLRASVQHFPHSFNRKFDTPYIVIESRPHTHKQSAHLVEHKNTPYHSQLHDKMFCEAKKKRERKSATTTTTKNCEENESTKKKYWCECSAFRQTYQYSPAWGGSWRTGGKQRERELVDRQAGWPGAIQYPSMRVKIFVYSYIITLPHLLYFCSLFGRGLSLSLTLSLSLLSICDALVFMCIYQTGTRRNIDANILV